MTRTGPARHGADMTVSGGGSGRSFYDITRIAWSAERWMVDNVAVRMDPAANLKIDKATSQGKVDGVVALVMALDRTMRHGPAKTSVYESRGLQTV